MMHYRCPVPIPMDALPAWAVALSVAVILACLAVVAWLIYGWVRASDWTPWNGIAEILESQPASLTRDPQRELRGLQRSDVLYMCGICYTIGYHRHSQERQSPAPERAFLDSDEIAGLNRLLRRFGLPDLDESEYHYYFG